LPTVIRRGYPDRFYSVARACSPAAFGRRFTARPLFFLLAGRPAFFDVAAVFVADRDLVGVFATMDLAPVFGASDSTFCAFEAVARLALAHRFFWAAAMRAFPSADIPRFGGAGDPGFTLATRPPVPLGLPGPRRSDALLGTSSNRSSTRCKCAISARRLWTMSSRFIIGSAYLPPLLVWRSFADD